MKGSGWQRDPDWTAISYSTKEGTNDSTGRTENSSVTHGTQYLGRTRVEQRDMGRLQTAIMDQLYRKRRDIATLGKGEAMVLIDGANPFILKVHQITAPFSTCSPEKRADVLEKYKVHICRSHPYSFSKSENPRLSVFLDDSSDTDDSQDRDDDPF
jgi:hypothetical protein